MIGYLSGEQLLKLSNMGCTHALYDVSTTYEYIGQLTSFYFFNEEGDEIAHQTMLSDFVVYNRKWGDVIKLQYKKAYRFNRLMEICKESPEDIAHGSIYGIY